MPQRQIPWWKPYTADAEIDAVAAVIRSNYLGEGEVTAQFEQRISQLVGSRYCVATTSGTAGIFLALAALGVGHGDEVIVPDVSFIATANAVVLAGATPVLADVEGTTGNIDVEAVRRAITSRTRAIVPVHVSGRSANMARLRTIADEHGLRIVEDAAQALSSRRFGTSLGTLGDAGVFSFSRNKRITTGEGGAIVTDDGRLDARLRELKDQGSPLRNGVHDAVGYNFKMTGLQAAVGIAQLRRLPERIDHVKRAYASYRSKLAEVPGVRLFPFAVEDDEIPQWIDAAVDKRDDLHRHLREKGIATRRWWLPIHCQKPYRKRDDLFPRSTALCSQAIWLPSAFALTDDDVEYVCRQIRAFYGRQ